MLFVQSPELGQLLVWHLYPVFQVLHLRLLPIPRIDLDQTPAYVIQTAVFQACLTTFADVFLFEARRSGNVLPQFIQKLLDAVEIPFREFVRKNSL